MILDSKRNSAEQTLTIPLSGVDRNQIGAMPYDPFMVPNGGNIGTGGISEVHLASVSTSYTGVLKGNGYIKTGRYSSAEITGFVWALILPENWQWPNEGTSIGIAYPDFIKWCNSDGKLYIDWYNRPTAGKVTTQYGI